MKIQNKQFGVTLMELLLALVVIAVLMFMAVRYYTVAREGAKVAEATTNIDAAVNASYQWLQGQNQKDFTGVSPTVLTNAGLIKEQQLKNPWGGTNNMTISAMTSDKKYVAIGFLGIPKTACESLKQKFTTKVQKISGAPQSQCVQQGNLWFFWGAF